MLKKYILFIFYFLIFVCSVFAGSNVFLDTGSRKSLILAGNVVNTINGQTGDVEISTSTVNGWVNKYDPNNQTMIGDLTSPNFHANYGISGTTGTFSDAISATTLNTGQGANELYAMNQSVRTMDNPTFAGENLTYGISAATGVFSGAIVATTLDTGQGANELYAMNQNVQIADNVSFGTVTARLNGTALNTEQIQSYLVVISTTPSVDDGLFFNGTSFIPSQRAVVGAGKATSFFLDDSLMPGTTYNLLSPSPITTAEVIDTKGVALSSGTVFFEAYSSTGTGLGSTSIEGGAWTFYIWDYVDNATGVSTLTIKVYSRTTGGVETELFSVDGPEINHTAISLNSIQTVQPAFAISATDTLVVKFFCQTTSVVTRNISFTHNGTTHYSYFQTPLQTRHNNLVGKQGGIDDKYYHSDQPINTTDIPTFSSMTITNNIAVSGTVDNRNISDDGIILDQLVIDTTTLGNTKISKSGTQANNQIAVFTGDGVAEGTNTLTFVSGTKTLQIGVGGDDLAANLILFDGNGNFHTDISQNTSTFNIQPLDSAGYVVINDSGLAAVDFRIEGDTDENLFKTDGEIQVVGIGTDDFDGTPNIGKLIIKSSGTAADTNILIGRNSANTNVLVVDSTGLLTATNGLSTTYGVSAATANFTGNILVGGTIDNRDISADGIVLDAVILSTAALELSKVNRAGDTMTGTLNGTDVSMTYGVTAATANFNGIGASIYGLKVSTGALFATSSGNVGIGTSNPYSKLEVLGASRFMSGSDGLIYGPNRTDGFFYFRSANLGSEATYTDLLILEGGNDYSATFAGTINTGYGITAATMSATTSLTTPLVKAASAAGLQLYDDGSNGIFVEDGGQIGIGTPTPAYNLDIVSANTILNIDATSGDPAIYFSTASAHAGVYAYSVGGKYIYIQTPFGTDRIKIYSSDGKFEIPAYIATPKINAYDINGLKLYDDGSNGIFIEDGGQVGIGTLTPAAQLEINTSSGENLRLRNDSVSGETNYFWQFITASDEGKGLYQGIDVTNKYFYWKLNDSGDYGYQFKGASIFLSMSNAGVITIPNLAGVGSRAVMADANGVLSAPVSARKYKTDIKPLDINVDDIYKLEPVSFTIKKNNEKSFGLIADDVKPLFPMLTFDNKDGEVEGIHDEKLAYILLEAVKSQNERIEKLEKEIKKLKKKK